MAGKKRNGNPSTITIILLMLAFAMLIPVVVMLIFLISAAKYSDRESKAGNLVMQPVSRARTITKPPISTIPYSKQSGSHFIVDQISNSLHLCMNDDSVDGRGPAFEFLNVVENSPMILNTDRRSRSRSTWQLCIAHHDHQHSFRLKTYPNPEGSRSIKIPKIDCDLYISASAVEPSAENWDWKSTDFGHDSITIHSYAEEFQRSKLDALFITISEKSNDFRVQSNSNRCVLEVEVLTIPNEELLHKLSLRGGQVILPRELKLLTGT